MEGYNRMDPSSRTLIIHLFFMVAMAAVVLLQTVRSFPIFLLAITPLRLPMRRKPSQAAALIGTVALAPVAPSAQAKKVPTPTALDFLQKQHSLRGCKPPEAVIIKQVLV